MEYRNNSLKEFNTYGSKHKLQQITLLASLLIPATNTLAEETPDLAKPKVVVPEMIAGVATVNAEQVIEILTSDKPPILVDARIKKDREYGHIESSISLPDIETNCDTLSEINTDKNQHMMFYCNGLRCGRSVVSIKVARSCGYHNLSWFKGGFAEWKDKGYQYVKNQ
ncbi:MAG: rhodanese-like domain-containing protein [Gammaproteobacteria bacterium]|nr:rhodanese-like domain-containing protein [Gammaproteobacteria bacterium]